MMGRVRNSIERSGCQPADLFTKMDTDGNGKLSVKELADVLCKMEPDLKSADLQEVFGRFDVNGDGEVELHEFLQALQNPNSQASSDRAKSVVTRVAAAVGRTGCSSEELFRKLDADGDGKLSVLELGKMLCGLQPDLSFAEVHAIFGRFDRDGSGEVELHEFAALLRSAEEADGAADVSRKSSRLARLQRHTGAKAADREDAPPPLQQERRREPPQPVVVRAPFGAQEYAAVPFQNPCDQDETFDITILEGAGPVITKDRRRRHGRRSPAPRPRTSDGVIPMQPACSLRLVDDPNRWSWLVLRRGFRAPPAGNFMALFSVDAGGRHGKFSLPRGASIELPLRCLSLEGMVGGRCLGGQAAAERVLSEVEQAGASRARAFLVRIGRGGRVEREVQVVVEPWPAPVDCTLRWFGACGAGGERRVPADLLRAGMGPPRPGVAPPGAVYCSDAGVGVRWVSGSLALQAPFPTAPSACPRTFFLALYGDGLRPFEDAPSAVIAVEAFGLFAERVRATVGLRSEVALRVPASAIFASAHGQLAALPLACSAAPSLAEPLRPAVLEPGGGVSLQVALTPARPGLRRCLLSLATRGAPGPVAAARHQAEPPPWQLLAAIVLEAEVEAPAVQSAHEVVLPRPGAEFRRELEFWSPGAEERLFRVRSSDPDACRLLTPEVLLPGSKASRVELQCGPLEAGCSADVYIFFDAEGGAVPRQVRLLRLSCAEAEPG
ncbi:unnamed protein product [Prorocentrum cordatum]|uniref:EF-hand domain-containing protein n=1 Tax=Prorocentrum cordatum TaxID=2364126 RepID=A0ABN9Q091_9DINO|nr:unnamed protein product [Polarella glacialis]